MSNIKPDAVLFDWDNTLVDSWPIIHAALNDTFDTFDKKRWSLSETKRKVKHSLRDSFPNYLEKNGNLRVRYI